MVSKFPQSGHVAGWIERPELSQISETLLLDPFRISKTILQDIESILITRLYRLQASNGFSSSCVTHRNQVMKAVSIEKPGILVNRMAKHVPELLPPRYRFVKKAAVRASKDVLQTHDKVAWAVR